MPYYQLVGYSWDHWINREVSRVTKSNINHVSIRVTPFAGEPSEIYVTPTSIGDVWVPSKVVERKFGQAAWLGRYVHLKDFAELQLIKDYARRWERERPGNVIHPYFHHYVGRHFNMAPPATCTRLCRDILNDLGVNVTEGFYPHELIKNYIKECY